MHIEIVQASPPSGLGLEIIFTEVNEFDPVLKEESARWVIRQHPKTRERTLERLSWGFIHNWSRTPDSGQRPRTTSADGIATSPRFGDAYRRRRCLVPVIGFVECKRSWGKKVESYVVTTDTESFALGGIWETWSDPTTRESLTTFALITTPANALVRSVAERMPLVIPPIHYDRWLSRLEFNPRNLLAPFPSEAMRVKRASSPSSSRASSNSDGRRSKTERSCRSSIFFESTSK